MGDRLFRARVGIRLDEAQRWDVPRLFRAPRMGRRLPRRTGCCPRSRRRSRASASTSRRRRTSTSTSRTRPNKTPRAFCAPIEVPGKVMLVIQPIGGPDDWRALFHEAGHAEHFAHTSRDLAMEARRLGDNAVTEGWAMLLEHLADEPAWLTRRLDFAAAGGVRRRGRGRAALLRPPLLREAPLRARVPRRGGRSTTMRGRYVELHAATR